MRPAATADHLACQAGAALNELRRSVMDLGRIERLAASPPQYLVRLLTSIVECTKTSESDDDVFHALEVNVVLWGIEAYLAA